MPGDRWPRHVELALAAQVSHGRCGRRELGSNATENRVDRIRGVRACDGDVGELAVGDVRELLARRGGAGERKAALQDGGVSVKCPDAQFGIQEVPT